MNPSAPLNGYKLVVAPALNLMPEDRAKKLAEYVQNGGHLVLGARTAMKDEYNALLPSRQPGKILSQLLGGDVVDFYALDKEIPVSGSNASGVAKIWAEMLQTTQPDTEVLWTFGKSNGWLDGKPAVITRKVGKGRITYVGGQFDDNVMRSLASWIVTSSDVAPIVKDVPQGVEVCRRVGVNGKLVLILINHTTDSKTVTLPQSMRELLRDQQQSTVNLAPSDVAVLVSGK